MDDPTPLVGLKPTSGFSHGSKPLSHPSSNKRGTRNSFIASTYANCPKVSQTPRGTNKYLCSQHLQPIFAKKNKKNTFWSGGRPRLICKLPFFQRTKHTTCVVYLPISITHLSRLINGIDHLMSSPRGTNKIQGVGFAPYALLFLHDR